MTDIKQTEAGDIDITNNEATFIESTDEVVQLLRQRLRTFFGEWFLDTEIGVPYHQEILKKNPNPTAMDAAFKNEILNTPGVIELTQFEMDIDPATRNLTLTFQCIATDGIIDFSEILGVSI